jgi:hypothetical protein
MVKRTGEVVYRYEILTLLLDIFPVLYVITLFIAGMNQEPNSLHYLLRHSLYTSVRIRYKSLMSYMQ